MKNIRAFTDSVLIELSKKMNKNNKIKQSKSLTSLDSLLKKKTTVNEKKTDGLSDIAEHASKKKVITQKDIEKMNIETLIINKEDILTPLAKDYIRQKKIKLEIK